MSLNQRVNNSTLKPEVNEKYCVSIEIVTVISNINSSDKVSKRFFSPKDETR